MKIIVTNKLDKPPVYTKSIDKIEKNIVNVYIFIPISCLRLKPRVTNLKGSQNQVVNLCRNGQRNLIHTGSKEFVNTLTIQNPSSTTNPFYSSSLTGHYVREISPTPTLYGGPFLPFRSSDKNIKLKVPLVNYYRQFSLYDIT